MSLYTLACSFIYYLLVVLVRQKKECTSQSNVDSACEEEKETNLRKHHRHLRFSFHFTDTLIQERKCIGLMMTTNVEEQETRPSTNKFKVSFHLTFTGNFFFSYRIFVGEFFVHSPIAMPRTPTNNKSIFYQKKVKKQKHLSEMKISKRRIHPRTDDQFIFISVLVLSLIPKITSINIGLDLSHWQLLTIFCSYQLDMHLIN